MDWCISKWWTSGLGEGWDLCEDIQRHRGRGCKRGEGAVKGGAGHMSGWGPHMGAENGDDVERSSWVGGSMMGLMQI